MLDNPRDFILSRVCDCHLGTNFVKVKICSMFAGGVGCGGFVITRDSTGALCSVITLSARVFDLPREA